MFTKSFWLSIESMAGHLDHGTRSEDALNQLEVDFMSFSPRERAEFRRRMVLVVSALARLEVRLMDNDGPLSS